VEAAHLADAVLAADVLALREASVLKMLQLCTSLRWQMFFLNCRQRDSLLAFASCTVYTIYTTTSYCKEKMKYSYRDLYLMNPVIEYQNK